MDMRRAAAAKLISSCIATTDGGVTGDMQVIEAAVLVDGATRGQGTVALYVVTWRDSTDVNSLLERILSCALAGNPAVHYRGT